MDPSRCMQDVMRCCLCEDVCPHLHCDICQEYLCKGCVGEHLLDESTQHKVVPFRMRVLYPSCSKHFTQLCDIYCEPCNIPICAECISSKDHLGHKQADILKAVDDKKEILQKDLKELENFIVQEFQAFSLKIPIQKAIMNSNSERVTTAIQKHGEYLRKEIESAVIRLTSHVETSKCGPLGILDKEEDKLKQIISEIEQSIAGLKKILKSNNVSLISAYKSRNAEFRGLLPHSLPDFRPCFTPQKVDREFFFQQFGSLSYSPIKTKRVNKMNAPGAVSSSPLPVKSLIDMPLTIKVIDTWNENSDGLYSVSCLSDDNIWTCGKNPIMRLYNLKGELVNSIITISGKRSLDIAVTRSGDLVYSDFQDRTVNILNDIKIRTMIKFLGWRPCYICSTSYDDLLVVNISDDETKTRIVRYSDSKEKQIIQYNHKGQPLFSSKAYPKYITENMNLDICVSDYYARAVVVVNQAGDLRFTYTGATKESFTPFGITTDSQGRILTADCDNGTIHILDKDGHFLRYIDDNLSNPSGICVDTSDNLFIAESKTGKVKVIQYCM